MDIPRINDKTNQMFFYICLMNAKSICQTKNPSLESYRLFMKAL